jgi:CheY-like chemotaxis protein
MFSAGMKQTGAAADFPPEGAGRLRVLVVDNERDAADSLAMLIQLWGHDVRTEYSGAAALGAVVAYQPDACLLDIGMPGLNGNELAAQIRRMAPLATLIAITGYGDPAHESQSRAAGFQRYLIKPVAPDYMRNLLHELQQALRQTARVS